MEDFQSFVLSAEMLGHEGPVRAVQALPDGRLASASQDHTARLWTPKDGASEGAGGGVYYEIGETLADHNHWVVSLAALPAGVVPDCPQGGLVTGCMDKLVRVYDHLGKQHRALQGHEGGVISFSWTAGGQLLSGSWDGSAKVWDVASGACLVTLGGHENGVCVLGLPDGKLVTGSTGRQDSGRVVDFQIRIWSENGQQIKTLKEHSGPVRSLDLAPGFGFLSTSNDGNARLWSLDGTPLATMPHPATREGEPAFVLQGCVLTGDAGESVSVDESGGCIVWRGSERGQSLPHPSGLWCVCALPNGDFATGCQDHGVRVWTRAPERAAPAEVAQAFDQSVLDGQTKAKQGPSAVEIAALPKWEEQHATRGKSEGQVQVFQRAGKAIAAQWSAASSTWIEVGEVMGASEAGQVDGETFDRVYVIEVEGVGGAVRKLQIGYNNGQNPFVAAQKFIDKNELPQSYLNQIADHLTKMAGETAPTIGVESGAAAGAGFSGVGDPTGFANSAAPPAPPGSRASGVGGGHFPVSIYATFEAGALAKVEGKIRELDAGLPEGVKMSEAESTFLGSLAATLAASSRYHISKVAPQELALLTRLVSSWPVDKCFPCIDLCRLAALHPHFAEMLAKGAEGGGEGLLKGVADKLGEGKDLMPVVLCGLRFFSNLFRHRPSRKVLLENASAVLDAASDQAGGGVDNKTVKLALATLFLNLAVASHQEPLTPGGDLGDAYQQLVALYSEVLGAVTAAFADDALYRALAGLGTLVTAGPVVLQVAKDLDLASTVATAQEGRTDRNVVQCATALLKLLR
ncbi:unnamed protein product [Pylaiella littoralis]